VLRTLTDGIVVLRMKAAVRWVGPALAPHPGQFTMLSHCAANNPSAGFERGDLDRAERKLLREGQWANARVELVHIGGWDWTVKDFSLRSWWVRNIIGRFLLARELRALQRLHGLAGFSTGSFRIDSFALAVRYLPGRALAQVLSDEFTPEFFLRLETLVRSMHARGLVHLDIRGERNLLLMPDGTPGIIDFQSSLSTRWMPAVLRRTLEDGDLSGVYKRWGAWQPGTLDDERRRVLERSNRLRRLWPFRGYPTLGTRSELQERSLSGNANRNVMNETPRGLFHHVQLRRLLVKLRAPIAIVALLLMTRFASRDWLLAGFVVSMLGELIQVWCFASLDKSSTLAVRGPYTMVRNPMYLGRYFILLGFMMLLGNWWVLAGYTVLYWLYMDARVQREERRLRPIFGESYDRYCAAVRRFVPGLPATGEVVHYWNWKLFKQNHAAANAVATVAAWVLIAVAVIWGLPFVR